MPEFKPACRERLPSLNHDHSCYCTKGHNGNHACYCGIQWDKDGRISILRMPKRRR
jgi:hypothetical protein